MKTKYNNKFAMDDNRTERHNSYIQTYLEDEINALLASSANQINLVEFNDIYVHNDEMEKVLIKYKNHSISNQTCIIEGLTGTGKTMLVRYVFCVHSWQARIDGNTIIIPLSFDNALYGEVRDKFSQMMHAACECLVKEFPLIRHIDNHMEDFYNYIKQHRHDPIYMKEEYPSPSKLEQLRELLRKNALAFYSCAFKFYLDQKDVCSVNNVVVIIDDIEGIRAESQDIDNLQQELLPIKMTLELIECMQNHDAQNCSWSLNTVICCRHYVSRMIRTLPFSLDEGTSYIQKLESYGSCVRYDLSNSPPIMQIIDKRCQALLGSGNSTSERWNTALQVVMQLLDQVDAKVKDFILDLTLRNIREAMNRIKQLVLNKRWIQRDYETTHTGAFVIADLQQYNVTSASLIRALGMNEGSVYNSRESIIPNLLYNEPYNNMEMFPLLTLKYFIGMAQYEEMSWDAWISISNFKERMHYLFASEEYDEYFRKALCFLLKCRVLLRSYDQDQVDNRGLNSQEINEIEFVYISKLALSLWDYLGTSSVFFEMYVDDIWLENDPRKKTRQVFRGFDTENYSICLGYMKNLIKAEKEIYAMSANTCGTGKNYIDTFGSDSICGHLLDGLERSLNAYYRQPVSKSQYLGEASMVERWKKNTADLRNECNNILSVNVV